MDPAATLPPLIDSHCHLTWPSFDEDRDEVIARMKDEGVEQAVVISTTVEDARAVRALCEANPGLYPTAGIHPNDLPPALDEGLDEIEALIRSGGFVAVGETGLDYYRDNTEAPDQQRAFRRHCRIAVENDLPVIVHIRDREGSWDAYDDVATIIEEFEGLRGVIHCYTGDPEHARRYLQSDFVISFSGIITFPKGGNVRESALAVPIERMLVETDAPFLAPVPRRGKRNEPAYVVHTARAVAELKELSEADVRRITTRNTRRLFRLPAEETIGPPTYVIRNAVYVNVTNACDAKCTFCPRTHDDFEVKGYDLRRPRDPTFEQIIEGIGDPTGYDEVVFCGFGEPTLRLDMVKKVARWAKERGAATRLNTNGHADLINRRATAAELVGLIDVVSVSLNAQDRETFERHCPSAFSPDGYTPMLDWIRSAVEAGLDVVCTALEGLEGVDMAACEAITLELGARWRGRTLNEVG
ncbi:MAG: YchF/TatD family DNA exonuclease [Planctomycetota bacterium]|nr:YchF/TatD family DNA exonuclease [Planctomycetota bacterium]